MERIVKRIPVRDGRLYASAGSRRVLLYHCKAEVELTEHSLQVPVLGRGKVIDSHSAALLITFDQRPETEIRGNDISGFLLWAIL